MKTENDNINKQITAKNKIKLEVTWNPKCIASHSGTLGKIEKINIPIPINNQTKAFSNKILFLFIPLMTIYRKTVAVTIITILKIILVTLLHQCSY